MKKEGKKPSRENHLGYSEWFDWLTMNGFIVARNEVRSLTMSIRH